MAEIAQIDFTIDGAPAAKTLGELETKADQLKEALKGAEIGSKEYSKLNQQLVNTNKQVKNLELGFEALDNEGVASQVGALAGAVGDVTGAMVLLGGENETIAQMAANIQMAMGVSMAFKGAIEGLSAATKLFNNVVRANPLMLWITVLSAVGTGIAALITYWDDFVGVIIKGRDMVVGVFNSIIELFTGTKDAIVTASMAEQAAHDKRIAQQKENADAHKERLANIETEKNAVIDAADETIAALKLEEDTLKAQGVASDEVTVKILEAEKAKTQAILEANVKKLQSWIEYYKQEAVLAGQSEQEFIDSMAKRGVPLQEFYDKANALILKNEQDVQYADNRITEFKREVSEKRQQIAQDEADRLAQLEKDRLAQEEADRLFKLDMLNRQQEADRLFNERLLEEEQARMDAEFDMLEAQIDRENALKEQQEQADQERMDRNKAAAEELFNAASQFADALHQRELKRANEKIARGEALTQKEIKRLQRQEKIEKAFALAQIAKDTAVGIAGAIKAGAGIPFPGNLAAIATGVAAVLSGIAQAAAVLGDSPNIPTGPTGTSPSDTLTGTNTETPVINPVQAGSTFLNQEPQKVYVVESEITAKQKIVKAGIMEATYG